MRENEWMDAAIERSKQDEWYQQWLQAVEEAEPAYLAILESLDEARREQLDTYIAACEALDDAMADIAYHLGREDGMRSVIPARDKDT